MIEPTYNKYFNWNKSYEFKYDLTRTLKVDFSETNGIDDKRKNGQRLYILKENRDTVWNNSRR